MGNGVVVCLCVRYRIGRSFELNCLAARHAAAGVAGCRSIAGSTGSVAGSDAKPRTSNSFATMDISGRPGDAGVICPNS